MSGSTGRYDEPLTVFLGMPRAAPSAQVGKGRAMMGLAASRLGLAVKRLWHACGPTTESSRTHPTDSAAGKSGTPIVL